MTEKTLMEAVRRARPRGVAEVGDLKINVRMPSEAAMRHFQANIKTDGIEAKAGLFSDGVLDEDGTQISEAEARELAAAPWVSAAVLAKIMEVSGLKIEKADAEEQGEPEKQPDAG